MAKKAISELETFNPETGEVHVVIETPRGSRNKIKYDPELDCFRLDKVLPAGAVFPHDFGFFPSTVGDDGDPLDVLLLIDEPLYPGIVVRSRLLGAIEAEQTAGGKTIRNDRLVAVAAVKRNGENLRELRDLEPGYLDQIEHFFISYNQAEGRVFTPIARTGPERARELLDSARRRYRPKS